MHIIIGLAAGVALLYFLRNWWVERRRVRNLNRYMMLLYPQADPRQMRQYVRDVYGRR